MDKTSFIFHTEWGRLFRRLSDADCKRLLQMMCDYAADNIEPEDTPDMVGMAFDCIRGLMDFDKERYHATCEKRRQAVQKRWDKQKQKDTEQEQEGTKNTNVSTCIDGDTKHTYSESYSESESYSDSESECIINNTHTHAHTHARALLVNYYYDCFLSRTSNTFSCIIAAAISSASLQYSWHISKDLLE